ncbi:MAG: OmpH family outer membrane protein [Terriglobia bacterium]
MVRLASVALGVGLWLAAPLAAQQFENVPEATPTTPTSSESVIKIGVLNVQFAMANTQEGKKASEDLRARFNPQRAELERLQREIRDLENQLRTQERTISDEARRELMRELEDKRKQANRMQEDLRDEVEQVQGEYVNSIGQKLERIIDQYAREKNLALVLNAFQGGPIIWRAQTVDITADIIALYDQTYPVEESSPSGTPPSTP